MEDLGARLRTPEDGVRRASCPSLTSLLEDLLPFALLVKKAEDLCTFPEPLPSLVSGIREKGWPQELGGAMVPTAEA